MAATESEYGLSSIPSSRQVAAPALDYLPHIPGDNRPAIGLVGAGGISEYHLRAYQRLGLPVVAICDVDIERATARRDQFYPQATVHRDYREVTEHTAVQIVDVATHPAERVPIVESALLARKHVLSQKPFVTELSEGRRLADLADEQGVLLAVNQNGRWAPHFSYLRQAVRHGLLGSLSSIDFSLQWDHTWTVDTPFNEIHHLLLYDFAIHWFDLVTALLWPQLPETVFASVRRAAYQRGAPPMLAQVVIDYPSTQVRMNFNGNVIHGQEDRTVVVGELGTLRATGPGLNEQSVQLWTSEGHACPALTGCWFDNGFEGTMAELVSAIDANHTPENNARDNLLALQLCFAAVSSADQQCPVKPRTVQALPASVRA